MSVGLAGVTRGVVSVLYPCLRNTSWEKRKRTLCVWFPSTSRFFRFCLVEALRDTIRVLSENQRPWKYPAEAGQFFRICFGACLKRRISVSEGNKRPWVEHGRGFSRNTSWKNQRLWYFAGDGRARRGGRAALCVKRRGSAGRMSHKASGGGRLGGRLELALRAKGTTTRDNRINLRLWDHGKPHDGVGEVAQSASRRGLTGKGFRLLFRDSDRFWQSWRVRS